MVWSGGLLLHRMSEINRQINIGIWHDCLRFPSLDQSSYFFKLNRGWANLTSCTFSPLRIFCPRRPFINAQPWTSLVSYTSTFGYSWNFNTEIYVTYSYDIIREVNKLIRSPAPKALLYAGPSRTTACHLATFGYFSALEGSSVRIGDFPRGNTAFRSFAAKKPGRCRQKFFTLYLVPASSSSVHKTRWAAKEDRLYSVG